MLLMPINHLARVPTVTSIATKIAIFPRHAFLVATKPYIWSMRRPIAGDSAARVCPLNLLSVSRLYSTKPEIGPKIEQDKNTCTTSHNEPPLPAKHSSPASTKLEFFSSLGPVFAKRSKSWKLPSIDDYDRQHKTEAAANTLKPNVPANWRQNKELPDWKRQMFALREKFNGQTWNPTKKVSRDTMDLIRLLKQSNPGLKSSEIADRFRISPESVRRILKSKWVPNETEASNISDRWKRRRESINKTASVKAAVDHFAQNARSFKKLRTPGDYGSQSNNRIQGVTNRKKSNTKKVTRLQDMIF